MLEVQLTVILPLCMYICVLLSGGYAICLLYKIGQVAHKVPVDSDTGIILGTHS